MKEYIEREAAVKVMFCALDTWTLDITIYKATPNDFCSRGERAILPNVRGVPDE